MNRREDDVSNPMPPTNRQRIDEMAETLGEIQKNVSEQHENSERFYMRGLAIFVGLALLTSASIGGFVLVLHKRTEDVHEIRVQARSLNNLVHANRRLTANVQSSRLEQSRRACNIRNAQNRGILRILHKFKADDVASVRDFPITHDCARYAQKAVKP